MTVLIFIIVLAVLILVHELGHFLAAKYADMRVDEFGLGLPPRAATLFRKGDTDYTLNWIPFGGFVKIYGEDLESLEEEDAERSFAHKPARLQVLVLIAGVTFNILFAWLLFTIAFMAGMPTAIDEGNTRGVQNAQVVITGVLDESPAQEAGISPGDTIVAISSGERELQGEGLTVTAVQSFIQNTDGDLVATLENDGDARTISIDPQTGIVGEGQALGISLATIGIVKLPIHQALIEAGEMTVTLLHDITVGFANFIADAVTGGADLSQVAGPVGIAGMFGDASSLGFIYLLSFTAFISLDLAILNLIPFPALDGGRLLFVAIEKIKGSPVRPRVFQIVNGLGFLALILLMIVVTFNDIARLI